MADLTPDWLKQYSPENIQIGEGSPATAPAWLEQFNPDSNYGQFPKTEPLPGVSPTASTWDYVKDASNAVVKGAAGTADFLSNPAATSKIITNALGLPSRHTDVRGPVLSNLAEEYLPSKPKDQLGAAISGVAEGALNPVNAAFGPPGMIAGAIGSGWTAWRNAASPDTPISNALQGAAMSLAPVSTLSKVPRWAGEGTGLLKPANPIMEAAQETGVTARTAAGIGKEQSFPKTIRMLRESPLSGAVESTERKGREQLESAIEKQASSLGFSENKEEAGKVVQDLLGKYKGNSGWINDTENTLSGRALSLNNAVDPATTLVPTTGLVNDLKTAFTSPNGIFQMDPGALRHTGMLEDAINKFNGPVANIPGSWRMRAFTNKNPMAEELPLAEIQFVKRNIGDDIKNGLFSNSDTAERDLNILWGKLSEIERKAYIGTPHEQTFNNLQRDWSQYFKDRNYIKSLIKEDISPGTTFNTLLNERNRDGDKLRRVFDLVPGAREEVAAAYLREMGQGTNGLFNPDTFFKNWENTRRISQGAREELFKGPNGDIPKIYDQLALMSQEQARSEAARNVSGTGGLNEAFRLTRNFVKAAALPALGSSAMIYQQSGNPTEASLAGAAGAGAGYAATMLVGPKLFTNGPFLRLLMTNPPIENLAPTLRVFASQNPAIAHEVTALQNYVVSKQEKENQGKFMEGGLVGLPNASGSTGYAEGGEVNPDLTILDRIFPQWRELAMPEDKTTRIYTDKDVSGLNALVEEQLTSMGTPKRDSELESVMKSKLNPNTKQEIGLAEGGKIGDRAELEQLENNPNLGYSYRQSVDQPSLLESIIGKYNLGPTANEHAREYSDFLRTFSNTKKEAIEGYAEGGSVNSSFQKAVDYYKANLGLTDEQARGAVKYMHVNESKLDPKIVNPSSGALGMAQWLGPRKRSLLEQYGPNSSLDQQLEFSVRELLGPEKKTLAAIKDAKTEKQAYDIWGSLYERPGDKALAKAGVNYNTNTKQGETKVANNNEQPKSIISQFISPNEEPELEKPDENAPVLNALNEAPWVTPEVKFAAKHILTENA